MTPSEDPAGPVARLQRWEAFGAHWVVLDDDGTRVTVSLCRCDGGEEVERLTSDEPSLRAFLAGRTSSALDE